MKPGRIALPLLAALLGACAGGPGGTPAPAGPGPGGARDCRQLDTEIAAARAAQREAQEKKGSAWKAVVPFAVAGRVASANGEIRRSEQRLAALHDEARRLGCRASV